jgi:choline dehydrogenase-like flavoprotein
MLVSAGEIGRNPLLQADLLVIGAGPAGLLLASQQAGLGRRIVVMESGGLEFARDVQLLNRGTIHGAPNHLPIHSRYRVYGGSTTRWAGQCVPLEPIDFESRPEMPHSGWPIGWSDIEPYYSRAASILGCNPVGFDAAAWEKRAGPLPPIANDEISAAAITFAKPLDIGQALRSTLEKSSDVTVVLGATVTAIETDEMMTAATGIRFATLDGSRGRCTARRVVLAAGGIENPRLLLDSTDRSGAGIGNGNDLVGRYFIDHPYLMPGWLEPSDPVQNRGWHVIETFEDAAESPGAHAVFTLNADLRRREGLPGCVGYFVRREAWQLRRSYVAPGGNALVHFAEVARGDKIGDTDLLHHGLAALRSVPSTVAALAGWASAAVKPQPRAALRICLEATPRADSRVTLGSDRNALGQRQPRIDWKLNDRDWAALHRFRTALAHAIANAGAGRLHYDDSVDPNGYPVSMTGGRHHMGTTRMNDDPRQGVVDRDLRVHGMRNLYILGSSVFPTGGWANPTLTIAALSLRLSDRLLQPD